MENANTSMYMPVAPAYAGGYGGNDGLFGGNGAWFILILLAMFGWGNGFGGGYGGNGGGYGTIQRGFDQAALTNGIGQIQNAVTNGFAQAEISANNRQIADMNQNFQLQSAFQQCLKKIGAATTPAFDVSLSDTYGTCAA